MAARPALTNVAMSNWGQPLSGQVQKTVSITYVDAQAPASAATSDVLTVGADYGIYDTTHAGNILVIDTNFKDPV